MNQLLSFLCFISIGASVYAQSTTTKFDYDVKVQPIAEVVSKQRLDSLTQLKKVVIDGFDSKAPFYLYENGRNKAKNYIFLLHGLGDSKDDWLFPSEPYLGTWMPRSNSGLGVADVTPEGTRVGGETIPSVDPPKLPAVYPL